ncbi:hypothetical protein F4810DRAFT_102221 [Camillea tinctor]|nr:hypothetical protein F4810DRAFT_102221 [Camillea tinctor]
MRTPIDEKVDSNLFGVNDLNPSRKANGKYQDSKTRRALNDKWNNHEPDCLIEELTSPLIRVAVKQLRDSAKPGDKTSQAREDITRFLEGEEKEHRIDDCVRWHLLSTIVGWSHFNRDSDALLSIAEIILEKRPYLAFECPYNQPAEEYYTKTCVDPKMHVQDKEKKTPFHIAAKRGISKAIGIMISNGKGFYGKAQPNRGETRELCEVVCDYALDSGGYDTALELATKAEDGHIDTLKELLKVDGITRNGEKPFKNSLNEGWDEVVEIFVEHDDHRFVTRDNIIQAIEKIDEPIMRRNDRTRCLDQKESKESREKIVRYLVQGIKRPNIFDIKVAEAIIQRGLMTVWQAKPDNVLDKDLESRLLHLAVMHGRPNFVELFVRHYPDSVSIQEQIISGTGKQFPLWYNNYALDENSKPVLRKDFMNEERARIRTAIVTKMIHHVNNMERLSDIFHKSNEPFGDLCFDISRFSSGTYRVSTFVDSLILHSGTQRLLSYEQTLRYAEFPPLDMMAGDRETFKENSHFKHEHTDVFKVLKWLREKGVRSIIKLKVPDRLVNPHNDQKIAEHVKMFEVEILDWKILDLSISIFKDKEVKDRIRELHLYSSGNRAVISHWFSDEGIKSLKKLESLEIKIVQETCTLGHHKSVINEVRERLNELRDIYPDTFKSRADPIAWYPTPRTADPNDM